MARAVRCVQCGVLRACVCTEGVLSGVVRGGAAAREGDTCDVDAGAKSFETSRSSRPTRTPQHSAQSGTAPSHPLHSRHGADGTDPALALTTGGGVVVCSFARLLRVSLGTGSFPNIIPIGALSDGHL